MLRLNLNGQDGLMVRQVGGHLPRARGLPHPVVATRPRPVPERRLRLLRRHGGDPPTAKRWFGGGRHVERSCRGLRGRRALEDIPTCVPIPIHRLCECRPRAVSAGKPGRRGSETPQGPTVRRVFNEAFDTVRGIRIKRIGTLCGPAFVDGDECATGVVLLMLPSPADGPFATRL